MSARNASAVFRAVRARQRVAPPSLVGRGDAYRARARGACSTTADTSVPIPIGDGYISGLKVAVAKVGPPYVGKLVVSVTPRGGGWPATYTCGSGGGLPVTLLSPLQALLLYDSRVGCVGAPASGGGRRRLASSATALNVSSLLLEVALRPVAADAPVPTLLLNGVPVAGEVPTPTPSSPTVTPSTASRAINSAAALIITGSGFDAAAAGNAVTLSLDAVGNVTSATSNRLDVTLTTAPTSVGSLTAIVTSFGVSSGPAVQVATVVAPPTVVVNTSSRALDAPTLVIAGTGFDASTPSANVVALSSGNGTVTGATPTSLTVAFSSPPSLGNLTAVVTSFGGASDAPVQVATVVAAPTVVVNTSSRAQDAPTLVIAGTGFDASTPSANVVALSSGNGTVTGATPTSLTVAFSSPPSLGNLTAVVTSFGGASVAPVQVATVVAAPTVVVNTSNLAQDAPTLVIAGTGFDASTASANVVALSSGNGTVTGATPTSLTVAFSSPPSLGNLTAVVTSFGGASVAPVQVATVVAPPTVVVNTSNLAQDAPTLVIAGTGFDASTASANVVALSSGNGTVTGATPTSLTVAFSSPPSLGNLTAVVTSFGGASVAPVQVATVVAAPTVVVNTSSRALDAPTLVIAGTGFDASTPSANVVALSSGNGTVTGATPTSLTVAFSSPPSLGNLTAVVTSFGGASDAAVQVATVVAAPTVVVNTSSRAQDAPTLVIAGTGFDASTPSANVVALSSGNGTVTGATPTSLTVAFSSPPSLGDLTAVVTSFGGASGAAVQVATVVAAPTVVVNTSSRAQDAPTLVIAGTGFDASTPSANVVALSSGNGTVTGATPTSLTVAFSSPPSLGNLTAVVTSFGGASVAPVQVATVVAAPTVVVNTSSRAQDAPTLVIAGTGFDASTPSANVVALSSGNGTVTGATPTSLTVAFSSPPSLGNLTAVVTSFGGASGPAVQVATVVAPPTVVVNTSSRALDAPTLVIAGTGFDASTPSANVVALSSGNGTVTGATPTSLTVAFSSPPSLGDLTAVVTSFGGASGAAVQVATVVAAPTVVVNTSSRAQDAPTLVIAGTGFDASTPSANVVALSSGNGTLTGATPTSLTVAFSSPPSLGNLTAVVTSFGGASVAPVQVATVVAPPTVVVNTSNLAQDAPTLVIAGTGFDASTASANVVALSSGNGTVTGATPTSLTVAFSSPPSLGNLTAVVTSFGGASVAPVQVATVVAAPTVVVNTSNLAQDAPTLVIAGTGFDASTASANVVALSSGNGTVTGATPTSLTVAFSSPPSLGNLTAVVTSFGGASGAAVQVATVVAAPTVVVNTSSRAQDAPTLVIAGTGFDASTPSANVVALSSGNGTVTGATPTSLTVAFSSPPSLGNLTAVVTSFGGASGSPVQVAYILGTPTVMPSRADRAINAPFPLVITGTNFDPTASGNLVVLNFGAAGTVTSATATQVTVTLTAAPTSIGVLTAVVNTTGGTSGNPVQVATVVIPAPASADWISITSSSDGTKLAAVVGGNSVIGGGIYTSSNSGGTWTLSTSGLPASASWFSITSSSDGTKLAAVASGGGIYTSSNSGGTWTPSTSGLSPSTQWSTAPTSTGALTAVVT